jgi:Holliday junction resolvase RusA-like endonuclease
MKIELNIIPPKATAQQKGAFVMNGKVRFFEKAKVRSAREILFSALQPYQPAVPFTNAVSLKVKYCFPYRKTEKKATIKNSLQVAHTVRPDLDNLEKLLLDVMTSLQFWKDDSQVCDKHTQKFFASQGKIAIEVKEWSNE